MRDICHLKEDIYFVSSNVMFRHFRNNKKAMVKIKKNVAISDTGFVFDPGTGNSYSLNPTGLEIVHLIKSEKNFEEILKTVTEKYEVDSESFERYYYDFIATLDQLNLCESDGED